MPERMERDLTAVVKLLAEHRWPFRLHATYDETITRALNVFEAIDREVPLDGLHWFIDHAETISPRNIERIRALGGGIAVQRMTLRAKHSSLGAVAIARFIAARRGVPVVGPTPPA
jgi:predicted amidohydrolase YtcJ